MLSKLNSFDMSGTIKIVVSAEYAKEAKVSTPLVRQLRFRIIADAGDLKETVESLDEAKKVVRSEVYYLNQRRVIWVDDFNGFSIKPFKLGENNGLFNDCPSFFEDAFLNLGISDAGFPAILASDLSSKEKWNGVARNVQAAHIGSDDHVYFTVTGPEGSSKIELAKPSSAKDEYQTKSILFLTKDNVLNRKIDVLASSSSEELGSVGNAFKVSVYVLPFDDAPAVTWEYAITDMKLNCPVDAEALQFEPRSVTGMHEAERGCYVTAAK